MPFSINSICLQPYGQLQKCAEQLSHEIKKQKLMAHWTYISSKADCQQSLSIRQGGSREKHSSHQPKLAIKYISQKPDTSFSLKVEVKKWISTLRFTIV